HGLQVELRIHVHHVVDYVQSSHGIGQMIEKTQKQHDVETTVLFRREVVYVVMDQLKTRPQYLRGDRKSSLPGGNIVDGDDFFCAAALAFERKETIACAEIQNSEAGHVFG